MARARPVRAVWRDIHTEAPAADFPRFPVHVRRGAGAVEGAASKFSTSRRDGRSVQCHDARAQIPTRPVQGAESGWEPQTRLCRDYCSRRAHPELSLEKMRLIPDPEPNIEDKHTLDRVRPKLYRLDFVCIQS